ncbi:tail fiber protein [Rhizobium sp. NPDC090275]|uniref:tail fiber protein n=1 Tax=Rhizobium sp. NPDC090275 TaxID=3364498 RepID=UPI00383A4C70
MDDIVLINELNPDAATRNHVVPAVNGAGAATRLSIGDILDLYDLVGKLGAGTIDNSFDDTDKLLYMTGAALKLGTVAGLIASLRNQVPVGLIMPMATPIAPAGALKANGAAYSRTTYAALFAELVTNQGFSAQTFTVSIAAPAVITRAGHGFVGGERLRLSTTGALPTGLNTTSDFFVIYVDANTFRLASTQANQQLGTAVTTTGAQSGTHSYTRSLWGLGDGSTTFNVPDLRGEHLRGWDDTRGVDLSRVFGSYQHDTFQGHWHRLILSSAGGVGSAPQPAATNTANNGLNTDSVGVQQPVTDFANGAPRVSAETRGRNVATAFCIKF